MSSFTYTMPSANVATALIQIETIQDLIASGNPNLLTSGQANAMANLYGLFSANPGGFPSTNYPTFTDANGKDMVVFAGVINNLAALGPTLTYTEAVAAAGSITPITNASFPFGANTVVYNDTYFLCEFPGTFFFANSAQGDGSTWTPFQATAEAESDPILALDQLNGQLVVFKQTTIQYFIDIGSTVSNVPGTTSYQNIPGSTQQYGLAAIYSRAPFMGSIAFLGQNFQGAVQVFVINGYTPTPISTSDINNLINSFTYVNDACAFSYTVDGHEMYEITFPIAGYSFLYDGYTQLWSILQSGVGDSGRHNVQLGCSFNYNNFVSDFISGNIYYYDINSNTDNGEPIKRMLITRHIFDQGNQFGIDQVWLDMDTGQGTQPQYVGTGNTTVANSNSFNIFAIEASSCSSPILVNGVIQANGSGWYDLEPYIDVYPPLVGPTLNVFSIFATNSFATLANTVLLLHFDGANGATTTVDSSPYARPVYIDATYASLNTHNPLYGTSALYATSYNPVSSDVPPVTVPFLGGNVLDIFANANGWTIECSFAPAVPDGSTPLALWDYGTFVPGSEAGNDLQCLGIYYPNNTVKLTVTDTNAFGTGHVLTGSALTQTPNTYMNMAVVSDGTTAKLYINGIYQSSTTGWTAANYSGPFNGGANVVIGAYQAYAVSTQQITIDEFRVSTGPRYYNSYAYATQEFPEDNYFPKANIVFLVSAAGQNVAQNVFTSVYFTDQFGNTQTYLANSATYVPSYFYNQTMWLWPADQVQQTSYPWQDDAYQEITFTWGGNTVVSSVTPAGFPYSADPQITMYVSKDGGRTYGNPRSKSMGKVGQYRGPRVVWNRLGSGRDFVLKFVVTDNVPFILNQGAVTLRPGTEGT